MNPQRGFRLIDHEGYRAPTQKGHLVAKVGFRGRVKRVLR